MKILMACLLTGIVSAGVQGKGSRGGSSSSLKKSLKKAYDARQVGEIQLGTLAGAGSYCECVDIIFSSRGKRPTKSTMGGAMAESGSLMTGIPGDWRTACCVGLTGTVAGWTTTSAANNINWTSAPARPGLEGRLSSILIGRAPTLLRSHWSIAPEC